ncbi:hypothetical protein AgCh_024400 [Apium graveolens]
MWSTACSSEAQIRIRIKGNSYDITPSVINEALHLPNSNFESLPTNEEISCMLSSINYTSRTSPLGLIGPISRACLRKEWSYFFDTLTRVFTSKYGGCEDITMNVQKIAYSLMYGRTIDIGSLLLPKISEKLGNKGNRSKVIYYARFLMIIAYHLCKELSIKDRDDTLQVCAQTETLFTYLVKKDFNHKVKFVLTEHIQAQLSNTSSSHSNTTSSPFHDTKDTVRKDLVPCTKERSPSSKNATSSVYRKRKITALPTTTAGGSEGNEESMEVNPTKKKMEESVVNPQTGLLDADPEMPPGSSRDGVLVVDIPSSPVEEKPKCDRCFVLEHTLKPDSREEDKSQDGQHLVNQHLVNTASVLKSQLVACLTSSADKLSHNDMTNLANRSFTALRAFGDDFTYFSREVNKLIEHRRVMEYAAKKKEKNDRDRNARYIQQEMALSVVSNILSGAQEKLFRAETYVESLKLKREELTGALLKLTEELSEEKKRVKNLAVERDQCIEARSEVEAELSKLQAEKEEAHAEFEAINEQYNAAKYEFERTNNQLLKLVCFCLSYEAKPFKLRTSITTIMTVVSGGTTGPSLPPFVGFSTSNQAEPSTTSLVTAKLTTMTVRARRSVVVTGYHSDSSDIKEKVPRKHPIGRCSKKKLKYSAFEQDQQLQEPVLVTNDVIGVVEDLEPMRTILSIFGARDIVRIRLNDEE